MARNKYKKVLIAIQLVVLTKLLCSSFFICSNCHSDVKSWNENYVTDYNLCFLLLFNPLFIGFFGVEKNVNNVLIIDAG